MDRIEHLPLAQLRESPFNPRKHYPEHELEELSASIHSQGVLQPIVVRPLPEGQQDIEHTHEIVFGHRRYRAAALAELEALPCIVRPLSDRDAAVAQTHENAKRADVTAFEEADSFAHLMHHHGLSADQVAAAVGKSRSHVYGRLKLHNAAPAVRQAFAEQGLSAETALELARIPNAKLQAEALKRIKDYSGDWMSTRDAKRALKHRYVFSLVEAAFALGDSQLHPSAGACHDCPKASFNDPDLQAEGGTFCIDQACFEAKEALQRERHLDDMAAAGHTVLEGEQAKALMPAVWRVPEGYVRRSGAGWDTGSGMQKFDALCEQAKAQGIEPPKLTLVVLDPDEEPIELVQEDQLDAFHAALGLHTQPAEAAPERPDPLAGWSPAERLTRDRSAWTRVRHAVIASVIGRKRTLEDLRHVVHRLVRDVGELGPVGVALGIHGEDEIDEDDLHAWADQASPDQLGALLVADALSNALDCYHPTQDDARQLVALAGQYGVDAASFAAPAEAVA